MEADKKISRDGERTCLYLKSTQNTLTVYGSRSNAKRKPKKLSHCEKNSNRRAPEKVGEGHRIKRYMAYTGYIR